MTTSTIVIAIFILNAILSAGGIFIFLKRFRRKIKDQEAELQKSKNNEEQKEKTIELLTSYIKEQDRMLDKYRKKYLYND